MKIGLVLAGGGGKGAYELGVWKALKELNLAQYISVFSGTSIGAFNSVLFAMDDMKKADELWEEVTMDKLVPISKGELIKRGIGLYIGGKNLQLAKKFLTDKLEHGAIFLFRKTNFFHAVSMEQLPYRVDDVQIGRAHV